MEECLKEKIHVIKLFLLLLLSYAALWIHNINSST